MISTLRMLRLPRALLILISALFIATVPLSKYMIPKSDLDFRGQDFDLAALVPSKIGEWRSVGTSGVIVPKGRNFSRTNVYDQELTRVYRNPAGDTVMLLIAYGHDQSDALQLHRPEICYAASGFQILKEKPIDIQLGSGAGAISFPGHYLETRRVQRFEPVTYWTRVGREIPSDVVALQLSKLWTGLKGRVPDGALIRVSSLPASAEDHENLHRDFITEMLASVPESLLPMLLGNRADLWKEQRLAS